MLDLSVIIVTYNTCELTCRAIDSVLSSRDDLRKEILLVDNGSTDNTREVVTRKFPSLRCLRSENNLGFAKAVNRAACEAQGEFLLLLNSDAVLRQESLSLALAWMRAHDKCGVAGAQLLHPDGSRQNSIANFPTLATELLNKPLLRRLFPRRFPGKEQWFAEPVEVETVVGAFFLARRTLWQTLGGMDERFFFFLEETDFCRRARQVGFQVMHLPQVQAAHGQGQTARQVPAAARIEYWRSRYGYFHKHYSRSACLVLRAGLCLRLLVDTLAHLVASGATLGLATRLRHKCGVYLALCHWHLKGCPAEMGLPR